MSFKVRIEFNGKKIYLTKGDSLDDVVLFEDDLERTEEEVTVQVISIIEKSSNLFIKFIADGEVSYINKYTISRIYTFEDKPAQFSIPKQRLF